MHQNVAALQSLARLSTRRARAKGLGQDDGGTGVRDPAYETAKMMADALADHGFRAYDMALYKAFQAAVGLTADGLPGANTMVKLADQLALFGDDLPLGPSENPVRIYPWKSGAWDGVNAPVASEWNKPRDGGNAPVSVERVSTTTTTTTATLPEEETDWTKWIVGGLVALGAAGVGYAVFGKRKRKSQRR